MPLYELTKNHISALSKTTFASSDISERSDLQRLLRSHAEVIAPDTLIIAEEFCDWDDSRRRIDLVGIDRNANLVVIELKRTEDGGHMDLQSIRYAAMLSTMRFSEAVDVYTRYLDQIHSSADAKEDLLNFLGWDEPNEDTFGQEVRIVLVSAEFSKEITTSVLWLNDHSLDIRCVRLRPYELDGRIILDVQQVIPLPEAESYVVQIKRKSEESRQAKRLHSDWESILVRCRNDSVVSFFRKRLDAGQHSRIPKRDMAFSDAKGNKGWYVQIQQDAAHVVQGGRFDGDLEFWRQRVSQPDAVRARDNDPRKLVFKLYTDQDITAFEQVMNTNASSIGLSQSGPDTSNRWSLMHHPSAMRQFILRHLQTRRLSSMYFGVRVGRFLLNDWVTRSYFSAGCWGVRRRSVIDPRRWYFI